MVHKEEVMYIYVPYDKHHHSHTKPLSLEITTTTPKI